MSTTTSFKQVIEAGFDDHSFLPFHVETCSGIGGHELFSDKSGLSRPPIIFVHGNSVDSSCWTTIMSYLYDTGYNGDELWAIDFAERGESHPRMSEQLDEFISSVLEYTGAESCQLVGHSLGATGIRYWLETTNSYNIVDTVVYIAGAIHGTDMCNFGFLMDDELTRPCDRISRDAMRDETNVLAQLNNFTGETPGDVDYYTIRAMFDEFFVTNPTSPHLDNAIDNMVIPTTHTGLLTHTKVCKLLCDWLDSEYDVDDDQRLAQ